MNLLSRKSIRARLLPALLLALAAPLAAQDSAPAGAVASTDTAPPQYVSPQAQEVLDRMTAYLRSLQDVSIDSRSTRDEVVEYGYKLQNNEHATLVMSRPNKLRVELSGDLRNRTIVYDGSKLAMYSPDDAAYVRVAAPDTVAKLVEGLLNAGVEMPLIDVLYQGAAGSLTEAVRSGIVAGESNIEGAACDHLAFRQANVDWQLWVEKGAKALPRKIVITTRYEVGDPQYQAILTWNLKPKIDANTFVFAAPKDAIEIPFSDPAAIQDAAP